MVIRPTINCLIVYDRKLETLRTFGAYLESMDHLQLTVRSDLPADIRPFDVIVTAGTASIKDDRESLGEFVRAGGGWLALVDAREVDLPDLFGVQPSAVGPEVELRVLFKNAGDSMAERLPEAIYVAGRYQRLQKSSADAEVILYADWHYDHSPVLTIRRSGPGAAACTTLQAYDHCGVRQILYRTIRRLAGAGEKKDDVKVGLLGYPPWLGRYHAAGVRQTAGLDLTAICDINPQRLQAAEEADPQISRHTAAEDLAADANVDLVIVSTPPDTHCRLSLQMMEAGKHVVCEKPLALNRRETRQMSDRAGQRQVHLSCHQNRRWDSDYLAIKQALRDGAIGEPYYLETFVGGFNHPCGYWHSETSVSGGLSYDWGGHYLDWITGLMPDPPVSVIGTSHKRVWHDVTNADQERIQIRFAGGQEAEFIHSDIAAATKPKWYLLGTRGAIVGNWQTSTALTTDPVVYYREETVPITEKTPDLTLYRRQADGLVTSRRLVLPQRQEFGFHRNLADHLLTGEPLGAPLADSMTVIAILEAAARSATNGGCVEKIDG